MIRHDPGIVFHDSEQRLTNLHPLRHFDRLSADPSRAIYGTTAGGAESSAIASGTDIIYSNATFYSLALTKPLAAPVQLSFSVNGKTVTSVPSDTVVTVNWQVLNAFFLTAQQCHASIMGSPLGAGNWSGPQTGTVKAGVYTGATTITPFVGGVYTYVLNCGGVETGMATLTVSGVTITTTSLPDGVVSVAPYEAIVRATGGKTPYSWGFSNEPPAGISLYSTGSDFAIDLKAHRRSLASTSLRSPYRTRRIRRS